MTKTIHFELVSPEQKLVSEDVHMAVMPGDAGAFGVMAGHASLVASLGNGVVRLYKQKDDSAPRQIFIAGGFADVTAEKCVVLAEEAVAVKDLESGKLSQRLRDLEEDFATAKEKADKDRIRAKIVVVKAMLSAAQTAAA